MMMGFNMILSMHVSDKTGLEGKPFKFFITVTVLLRQEKMSTIPHEGCVLDQYLFYMCPLSVWRFTSAA